MALLVFVRVHWGWSIRIPYASIGGRSYLLPPPTTLLGTLAEHYAIRNSLPENGKVGKTRGTRTHIPAPAFQRISEFAENVSAGLLEGVIVRTLDITRVDNVPYLRKAHQSKPAQWFGLSGFGLTLAPNALMALVYVLRGEPDELLIESAWSVSRLGSKESIVSVEHVAITEARRVRVNGRIQTPFYLRLDMLQSCNFPPSLIVEEMPTFTANTSYTRARYILPLREVIPDVYAPQAIVARCRDVELYEVDVSSLPRRILNTLINFNVVKNNHLYIAF